MAKKIEIKMKECCLNCEHFDPSGITGISEYATTGCNEQERVIACGHMKVCKKYNEEKVVEFQWEQKTLVDFSNIIHEKIWKCQNCGLFFKEKTPFCPYCGSRNGV